MDAGVLCARKLSEDSSRQVRGLGSDSSEKPRFHPHRETDIVALANGVRRVSEEAPFVERLDPIGRVQLFEEVLIVGALVKQFDRSIDRLGTGHLTTPLL